MKYFDIAMHFGIKSKREPAFYPPPLLTLTLQPFSSHPF